MNIPKPFELALREFDAVASALKVEYVLIGGIAVVLQGYDRATRDIDLTAWDIDSRFDAFIDALFKAGFKPGRPDWREIATNHRVLPISSNANVSLDISLGALPFEREMIERSSSVEIASKLHIKVAGPEYLVAMKLLAGRQKDVEDARQILDLHPSLDRLIVSENVAAFAEALDQPEILQRLANLWN